MAGRRQKILNTILRKFGINSEGNLVSSVVGIRVPLIDPETQLLNYVDHFDDFMGDLIPDEWAVNASGAGAAAAITVGENGLVTLNGGTTTSACTTLTTALQWSGAKNVVFVARVTMPAAITSMKWEVGLVSTQANNGAWGTLAEDGSGDTDPDCVIFIFDTDKHASTLWVAGSANTVGWGGITTGVTLVVNATYDFKIVLTDDAALMYYKLVGTHVEWQLLYTKASGAVTAATLLQPWFVSMTRTNAARILTVDYSYCRQDRT